MTDAKDAAMFRELYNHLQWDGWAFWLPEWAIKEIGDKDDIRNVPYPTMDEFREELQRRFDAENARNQE